MPNNTSATPTEPLITVAKDLHDIFCTLYRDGECEWYENPETIEHWATEDDAWALSYCRKRYLEMAKQLEQETDLFLVSQTLRLVRKVVYNRR